MPKMLNKLTRRFHAVKYLYSIQFESLAPWPIDDNGYAIYWQRGMRKKGKTEPKIPELLEGKKRTAKVDFAEVAHLSATLYSDSRKTKRTGPYQPKELQLFVVQIDKNGEMTGIAGEAKFDMAELAGPDEQTIILPIEGDEDIRKAVGRPQLKITVRSWYKGSGGPGSTSSIGSGFSSMTGGCRTLPFTGDDLTCWSCKTVTRNSAKQFACPSCGILDFENEEENVFQQHREGSEMSELSAYNDGSRMSKEQEDNLKGLEDSQKSENVKAVVEAVRNSDGAENDTVESKADSMESSNNVGSGEGGAKGGSASSEPTEPLPESTNVTEGTEEDTTPAEKVSPRTAFGRLNTIKEDEDSQDVLVSPVEVHVQVQPAPADVAERLYNLWCHGFPVVGATKGQKGKQVQKANDEGKDGQAEQPAAMWFSNVVSFLTCVPTPAHAKEN